MESGVHVILKMEEVLNQLISNAEKLKDISLEGFSEEAVAPLQEKQELLVEQLNTLESTFESVVKEGEEEDLAKIGDRLSKKLRYFQHLNAVFIENITEGNSLQSVEEKDEKKI